MQNEVICSIYISQGIGRSSRLPISFLPRSFSINGVFVPASFLLRSFFRSFFRFFWNSLYTHPQKSTCLSHFLSIWGVNFKKAVFKSSFENFLSSNVKEKIEVLPTYDEFFYWKERKKERNRSFFRSSIFAVPFLPRSFWKKLTFVPALFLEKRNSFLQCNALSIIL